ncbi:hypothetical protein AC579_6831 [Pseudocercospora musae]|uniref:Uncharacterized protein n=1 Tax=Pseudocercospora musae TaxID=113226 RepID=A0A139IQD7_9PEZI|nr:hypothetical protein AC579_6831 [Pseudocercospora musae]
MSHPRAPHQRLTIHQPPPAVTSFKRLTNTRISVSSVRASRAPHQATDLSGGITIIGSDLLNCPSAAIRCAFPPNATNFTDTPNSPPKRQNFQQHQDRPSTLKTNNPAKLSIQLETSANPTPIHDRIKKQVYRQREAQTDMWWQDG